jgi:hypothetical protein
MITASLIMARWHHHQGPISDILVTEYPIPGTTVYLISESDKHDIGCTPISGIIDSEIIADIMIGHGQYRNIPRSAYHTPIMISVFGNLKNPDSDSDAQAAESRPGGTVPPVL